MGYLTGPNLLFVYVRTHVCKSARSCVLVLVKAREYYAFGARSFVSESELLIGLELVK